MSANGPAQWRDSANTRSKTGNFFLSPNVTKETNFAPTILDVLSSGKEIGKDCVLPR